MIVSRARFSRTVRSVSSSWMWQSWLRGLGRLIQQEDFLRKVDLDLEHVGNRDSRHSLQPRILDLAFPHPLVSHHDLAHQHGLAVHLEEKTLVQFAWEASSLIHRVHSDVNLIVGETVQNDPKPKSTDTR